ncbi:AP-4 complex accessory subunit Tepsin [Dissophora globulifera]|uniref:AP-4 complex accessory subunit Tepsin n=1 Tax=Dissophora globulifera TaxID=979702 RepID=A0A9P6RU53_9FUNG|nr:AP-4 complex accessory subunit Tepsin [Dissophora globulifera]
MNQLTETTRSTMNTLKAHALLGKALSNDAKPTPGYLFPEIAQLTRSPKTSAVVLTQLLKVITASNASATSSTSQSMVGHSGSGAAAASGSAFSSLTYTSSPHVLLKALKILRQLAQSGSAEFRTHLARFGKAHLVEMVSYRGQWDEIHGDRLNQDVRSVAEDLIEYMHANPVQEQELNEEEQQRSLEASEGFTDKEAAVLKNNTQGLMGFGNPEYDDSDSDDDMSRRGASRINRKREKQEKAAPPLPGFGNPAFEKDSADAEGTLLTRLFDTLQEMTAPPPPLAMRAAFRQQEQRRQKLFVGEYSMRDNDPNSAAMTKDGAIILMGTNPFKRTTRIQGMAAGGWGEKTASHSGGNTQDMATSRVFPQSRVGTRTVQFRNSASASVYGLAQYIQTTVVRSKLQQSMLWVDGSDGHGDLLGTPVSQTMPRDNAMQALFSIWGTAKEICDVIIEELRREKAGSLLDHLGETEPSSNAGSGVSVMTGLVRDLNGWIEQEDWERRANQDWLDAQRYQCSSKHFQDQYVKERRSDLFAYCLHILRVV